MIYFPSGLLAILVAPPHSFVKIMFCISNSILKQIYEILYLYTYRYASFLQT